MNNNQHEREKRALLARHAHLDQLVTSLLQGWVKPCPANEDEPARE